MTTREIVQKLWNLCNVLRDDGITYHQYVTELTYILFLKMASEVPGAEEKIPADYRWNKLAEKSGITLKNFYDELLKNLGKDGNGIVSQIYRGAVSNIKAPGNLEKIITDIDALDWYSAREEGLGDLYEGLLEKNANEKKSGAGQYFTPRVLIDVIVRLTKPQAGERCNDPACGTFGFMIAAAQYVKDQTDDFFDLKEDDQKFEVYQAFTGCELVPDTHRLALMNAALHGLSGEILCGDTLSETGKQMKNFAVVLSNPPFGTKRGGERASRDDFVFSTSNKQLNFLQHIYRSLRPGGRAAVVLPDNVLFADGDGERIRVDLMDKCNLHTILRLPTGIFYAQGVKTNVLFFSRGFTDYDNTAEVWFYDLRTNMPSFGKTNPLACETFADFERAFDAEDRRAVHDERFSVFTRAEISAKGNSLDLGLIRDSSAIDFDELPDPRDTCVEILTQLAKASALISSTLEELKASGAKKNANLPSNWRLTSWGQCGNFIAGTAFKNEYQGFTDYEIPFYKVGSLKFSDSEGFIHDNSNTITEDIRQILKAPKIPPCAILFAKIGEAIRLNRRCLNSAPCCIDNNLMAFISNAEFLFFRYAYYWSLSIDFYQYTNATTVPAIRKRDLENIPLPLPPLSEQERIVARLDSLFEKLDAASEILHAILAGEELRRSAILHRAFTGELTESWRDEHGVALSDWQQKKLGELLLPMETQKPTGKKFRYIDIDSIDNRWQSVKAPKILDTEKAPSRATRAVDTGNILFSLVRPYLKNIALIDESLSDCIASTGFFVCRCSEAVIPEFLYNFLRSAEAMTYLMQFMKGDNSPSIRNDDFTSLPIHLPPLAEQKEIARVVGGLLAREAQATALVESSLTEIATLKKAILGRAFRGELGTNDIARRRRKLNWRNDD